MAEEKTLTKKLDEIIEKLGVIEDKKAMPPKKFTNFWNRGKYKKNYAIVQIIRTNGAVDYKMLPIEDDVIKIGDSYHDASANYILRYKKYPLIIVPEWNINPIKPWKPEEDYNKASSEGTLTAAEKVILNQVKQEQIKGKKTNFGGLIWVLLAGVVVFAALKYFKVF